MQHSELFLFCLHSPLGRICNFESILYCHLRYRQTTVKLFVGSHSSETTYNDKLERTPLTSLSNVFNLSIQIPIPSTSALSQISAPRNSPPPDFLLDDDPFANLTGFVCLPQQPPNPPPTIPQSQPQQRPVISPPSTPRPLHHMSLSSSKSLPFPHRPSPAHQRPAFKSRPFLPSLNTRAVPSNSHDTAAASQTTTDRIYQFESTIGLNSTLACAL
jgi:hypothetical protein